MFFGGEGYPVETKVPAWKRKFRESLIEERNRRWEEPEWSLCDTWLGKLINKHETAFTTGFLVLSWAAFIGARIYFKHYPTIIG